MKAKELLKDNKGSFTVEMTFVMLVIIGVIITMLYAGIVLLDQVNSQVQLREYICGGITEEHMTLLLGEVEFEKVIGFNLWDEEYKLFYTSSTKYPFVSDYVTDDFGKMETSIKVCGKRACDTVRMYDAIRNKEGVLEDRNRT